MDEKMSDENIQRLKIRLLPVPPDGDEALPKESFKIFRFDH